MDIVFIEGLQIDALIGIYDWERRIRQPLLFDLEMQFDNTVPAASDAIEDTLDYKAVSKRLIEYVGQSDFGLVETLAERVAAIVLDEFGVERVRLKLSKPGAVRGARAVGVMIERSRQPDAPRRARATPAAIGAPAVPAAPVAVTPPEVEAAEFAAAVPRGGATSVPTSADASAPAPGAESIAPDPTRAEAAAMPPSPDGAAGSGVDETTVPAEAEPAEVAGVEPAAGANVSVADAANAIPPQATPADSAGAATSQAVATDSAAAGAPIGAGAAIPVDAAAARDDDTGSSPLEAALLAAVSGWHSPRPTPAGLDEALSALGEKGGRTGRKSAKAVSTTVPAPPPERPPVTPPELPPPAASEPVAEASAPPALPPMAGDQAAVPAPSAPVTTRANFMRDLEQAPVRPLDVAAPERAVPAAAPTAAVAAPATAIETPSAAPSLPPSERAAPAEPPPIPARPSAPAEAPIVPAFRTAPPPPPRPRNPASDLGRTTRPAYLSLGSNIEPEKNLRSALMALRARFGEVIVSPVYRMPAVGFEGPEFLNAAAIIDSDLDPFALTRWLHGIESAHGRMRSHVKNSSRTLDMDIIFFDDLVLDMPGGLQLPRPELRHAFVLKPLVDIAPGFVDPVRGVPLADVWAAHKERETKFSTVII